MQYSVSLRDATRYVSELIDIHDLLEKADRTLFEKIRIDENHPLYHDFTTKAALYHPSITVIKY